MSCSIPNDCKLDLWAKVIVAKNIQTDEPILGNFDEYGEPVPENVVVSNLGEGERVECIEDFKISFDQDRVVETFTCTSKVTLTIPFSAFFFVKTNKGFVTATKDFTFTKTIPVSEFVKLDGTPLTSAEFKCEVDQSKAVVCNYEIAYVNILPKVGSSQVIQVVITATVVDKLGKYKDVLVYGVVEDLGCECNPCSH